MIDTVFLKNMLPNCKLDLVQLATIFNTEAKKHGLSVPLHYAHFWAQVAHETNGGLWWRELWGPTAIQKTYEPPSPKAKKLGNTFQGDGYKFRGAGAFQLTGRYNFMAFAKKVGRPDIMISPEKVASEPKLVVLCALWYWENRGLTPYADMDDCRAVSGLINAGTTRAKTIYGLADRIKLTNKAKALLQLK